MFQVCKKVFLIEVDMSKHSWKRMPSKCQARITVLFAISLDSVCVLLV